MNSVNKTLYIPLYGKAYVSRKALFLDDKKAEEIWDSEGFHLKGKSKSKWLAYYMGIRSAVFDDWTKEKIKENEESVIIHLGSGMDSRALRINEYKKWYDVDFPEVISERKRYYEENERYKMIGGDIRKSEWLKSIPKHKSAVIIMEGVSMYLTLYELNVLTEALCEHFDEFSLLTDCYSSLAAKMSKYKNPVNDVGVSEVFGIDNPELLENGAFSFVKEHEITPEKYINQLKGLEKRIFSKLYAGKFSKKLYRLFEFKK